MSYELQEVEILIGPEGRVEARVSGVKGSRCVGITAEMLELLGNEVEVRDLTDEYYRQDEEQENFQEQSNR